MVLDFYASVSGKQLNLAIGREGIKYQETQAPIGVRLLDFIYFNPQELYDHLDHILVQCATMEPQDYDLILAPITKANPYLRYLGELFIDMLYHEKIDTEKGFAALCEKFSEELSHLREKPEYKETNHETITADFLIWLVLYRAAGAWGYIKEQLDFCMNSSNDPALQELSPMQRLYLYEQWLISIDNETVYFDDEFFQSRMVQDKELTFPSGGTLEDWKLYLKQENPVITEMTELPNVFALLRYEMMHLVMQNVPIKRCAHCERYFINTGRSDKAYCSRPLEGQPDKTCESVGALLKHQNKVKNSDIIRAYNTAYKRANSSKRIGNLTEQEFKAWSAQAREKRDLCLAGNLSKEDFHEWLNRDRIYKPRD